MHFEQSSMIIPYYILLIPNLNGIKLCEQCKRLVNPKEGFTRSSHPAHFHPL